MNTPSPVKSYEELEQELAETKEALRREQARHKITQGNFKSYQQKLELVLISTQTGEEKRLGMTQQHWTFECPFTPVIEAACRVAGKSLECDIDFGELPETGVLGATNFPHDGSRIQVRIQPGVEIERAMDTLAHELAHVIVGQSDENDGHGPEWEAAYAQIHQEYMKWYQQKSERGF